MCLWDTRRDTTDLTPSNSSILLPEKNYFLQIMTHALFNMFHHNNFAYSWGHVDLWIYITRPGVVITLCIVGSNYLTWPASVWRLCPYWGEQPKIGHMMASSNGNIFRVTGLLWGEFTGDRWIPHTKASHAELWWFLWFAPWINGSVNNREAGDLRCHRAHYDVIVLITRQYLNP